jgi:hypothetical protein
VPDRRLVLPVAAADPARFREADDPENSVVLVLPSLLQLLQACWVDDLGARRWSTFEGWLDAALSGEQDEPGAWRYDEVVAAWVDVLGADRVQVVLGGAGETDLPETPGRVLSWAEVGMVEALVADLVDLELVGRNAAEMVWSGVDQVRRTDVVVPLAGSPLPRELQDRIVARARTMAARLDSLGVQVTGDRAALAWPGGSAEETGAVGLREATQLAMGALEQVAAWGREETG